MRAADPLPPDLDAALGAFAHTRGIFGARVIYFHEIGSTNDVAAVAAEQGEPEGTLVIAAAQTAGRGRLGRTWHSPPGAGLYVSALLRDPLVAPWLTLAGGVGVAEGLRQATGLPVQLKWPNDVVAVADGAFAARRKIAGILAEASSGADGVQYVVLGFGINVRAGAFPPELGDRATSLELELGRAVDQARVLVDVLAALNRAVSDVRRGAVADMLARWRALAPSSRGAPVEWDTPAGARRGTTAGLDGDGALLVREPAGVERIISGEVRWL
jgi:BirA family transcriptional regulator, biotin operon repressor / biotin---[acetyl-CoA-carboxylase] ligase